MGICRDDSLSYRKRMDKEEMKIYCDRCNAPTARLKRVWILDVSINKDKLLWVCPECYEEHPWKVIDELEQASTSDKRNGQ